MNAARLGGLLAGIGRPRIIVVGEALLDEYVWGEVERISPEAPIPVLRVTRREERVGGAGSVVSNLLKLGAEVRFLSTVGDDGPGRSVLEHLKRQGARGEGVVAVEGRRTIVKARHLGYVQHANRAVQQLLRVDEEDVSPPGAEAHRRLLSIYQDEVKSASVVLVSDYRKGLLTADFLRSIIQGAGQVPVLVDPGRFDDYQIYRGAHLICPNRYETARASGLPCATIEESGRAAARLIAQCGFDLVAVTLDRDGIFLQSKDGSGRHFPTSATVVADVAGAGDMVLSVLGLVLGAGGGIEDAVRFANLAAGIEIRRVGVVPVSREEILAELRYQGHPGVGKLKTRPELVSWVAEQRAQGRKIVFTNGCFDLLHFGHHHLLNRARRLGDCLVVAVNSDSSIRRLKGPGRPINSQEERMLMLSGLEAVDCVILFEEDTPIPLLDALRPEVLVKGSEYRDGEVVGRSLVESYGGRVELVEQVPGISTTAILEMQSGRAPLDGPARPPSARR
jgi:D-beta-D-heptose 7-phosphate kinase/D-beta-D-heptose 1-phosphate adenosyltransferase